MPGILTRFKNICSVWLAIKWPGVVTIVSRAGGCGDLVEELDPQDMRVSSRDCRARPVTRRTGLCR
jgi:hypothetical protein